MVKKLYRQHRGTLADSLATTQEVEGINDIIRIETEGWRQMLKCEDVSPYICNIRIKPDRIEDDRLPQEWNGGEYYVVADLPADGFKGACIGMSNFNV